MSEQELTEFMTFRKKSETFVPLFVSNINGEFIIAAYQGALSEYDILIRYRQNIGGRWSYIRTPKHIHWAVDVLIKMHSEKEKTKEFLHFLLDMWNKTEPMKSESERREILNIENLIAANKDIFDKYEDLGRQGEYSIKFLVLLARLLMIQEKTNLETAYMFKNLIEALKSGEDIFKIVSIATHGRRS
ncbi:MAG: hypothetical protein R6U37_05145 [Dehalococcoidia bacterium]